MCANEKPVLECSREVGSQSSCISVARTWGQGHHQSSRKPNRNALLPGLLPPVLSRTQVSIQPLLLPSSLPHLSQPLVQGSPSLFLPTPLVQGSPSPFLPTPLVQGPPVYTLVFPFLYFLFLPSYFPSCLLSLSPPLLDQFFLVSPHK